MKRDATILAARPRRTGTVVDTVIVHAMSEYIVNGSRTQFCINFLNEIDFGAHYFITPDGVVIAAVSISNRTSHVGSSKYKGRKWLNETSIGIEFLVDGRNSYGRFIKRISDPRPREFPFTSEQYDAGVELILQLQMNHPQIEDRIVRHCDVSGDEVRGEGRGKRDPGSNFAWKTFLKRLKEERVR